MRLASFSVSSFRSITNAKKVPLADYSVLVGANNEGKSNILHALAIGMQAIEGFKYGVRRDSLGRIIAADSSYAQSQTRFDWLQDYPIAKQSKADDSACTEINFEFRLTAPENDDFYKEVGSKLNGTLPVSVHLYRGRKVSFTIPKQGPGAAALNTKVNKITNFISNRLSFEYIPAVRTSASAEDVISDLLYRELRQLEFNDDYREAVEKVNRFQDPILAALSEGVSKTVASFLPSVKKVDIRVERDARIRALRRGISIVVDDGNTTPLERKGDGVKSLVALALMRHASPAPNSKGTSIVAIEEPEAHLHPQAVHELRDVLVALSESNQVILTTHSPLFVNPAQLDSTIIVRESRAGVAKNIAEVRDVLGVRLSDNLQSARLIAIVEGDDDAIAVRAFLEDRYAELGAALKSGDLAIDCLGGATNLAYKIRTYRASATAVQCLLDGDDAGKKSVQKALNDNVIRSADYNLINVIGQREAEMEDLFDPAQYKDAFLGRFGVNPTIRHPSEKGKKWSDWMGKSFTMQGKIWDGETKMQVKLWLAHFAKDNVDKVYIESRLQPMISFAEALETKLGKR